MCPKIHESPHIYCKHWKNNVSINAISINNELASNMLQIEPSFHVQYHVILQHLVTWIFLSSRCKWFLPVNFWTFFPFNYSLPSEGVDRSWYFFSIPPGWSLLWSPHFNARPSWACTKVRIGTWFCQWNVVVRNVVVFVVLCSESIVICLFVCVETV